MKRCTTFIFLLLTCAAFAQNYVVIHVQGTLLRTASKQQLQTGESFLAKDSLTFPKKNAWAVVADSVGTLLFVQNPEDKPVNKKLAQVLSAIERGQHAITRKTNAPVADLKAYFEGAQFVFIGTTFTLPVDSNAYPLDEKLFLLYRYEYNARIITHKLPQNKHVLTFSKDFLYEYKGQKFPYEKTTKTELSYFNSMTNIPVLAATFRPIWLDEEVLKKELNALGKIYGSKHFENMKVDIHGIYLNYVKDIYGKTDEVYFREWVEKNVIQ